LIVIRAHSGIAMSVAMLDGTIIDSNHKMAELVRAPATAPTHSFGCDRVPICACACV
jgi:hypothetical protein